MRRTRLEELGAEKAALEKEVARERDVEAANRQTEIEQEAELAAEEARVLALRIAIQARRGRPVVPPPVANLLGNANATRDGALTTVPFQPYRTQAMSPLFRDLAVRYPAINESLFKAIFDNTLAPINILKLSTDYTPERERIKFSKINSTLAVETVEEDALLSKVQGCSHLLRCFLLYCTILLHFIPLEIRYDLTIGLHAYIDRFFGFTLLYTWDSVKFFHFMFHRARMSEGIADGLGWSQANNTLSHCIWSGKSQRLRRMRLD